MPLLKRKALQKVVEPVNDDDEVFVCEITGELFRKYDDFFNRTMLLSSTVWCCTMTGRMNLTYRDALESERSAKRTVKTFPDALKGPILLIASRTKRSAIHDLACDVHGYTKDVFFKGETVYTKTGVPETIREAKIIRVVISGSPSDHNPSRLIYHVESHDAGTPANYSVRGEAITRKRNSLSREKCKLFLKQHVELGANHMLCVKKESLEQFVTSKGCTDDIVFYGQKPVFEVSKKLQQNATKSTDSDKEQVVPSNKKQQSIEKYMKQSAEAAAEKEAILEAKIKRLEERAKQMALANELMLAEKDLLHRQVALALKEYSAIKEDLELTDQRVIPPAREVRTLIGEEHFSDFVFILEFLNTFSDLLSAEIKFPRGITMEQLERALLLREFDGPLSDILQLLLRTIFAALKELDISEEANLEPRTKKVFESCITHFSTKLTDLPMDSTTVSELLRLHISAYDQPIYFGDACSILIRDHPHIMQTLTTHTVFQLPTKSVIAVICALIHQLLVTDEVQRRVEKVGDARMKFKTNLLEQRRLTAKTKSLKQVAEDSMKRTLACYVGQMPNNELDDRRKELDRKLTNELVQIEKEARLKMKELKKDLEVLKKKNALYQMHLGSDRGFRNYWQFQSIPGLFVEHDTKSNGCCLERVTLNIPALAHNTGTTRKKYITESILKCAGKIDGLLEREADIYEELLIHGSSLLEKSNKLKKDTILLEKSTAAEANNVPAAHPTNRELFMCTGDEKNCPVHHPIQTSNHHAKWSYYATRQELDALTQSLNNRGRRERSLREALVLYRESIEVKINLCPTEKLSMQENDRTIMLASMLQPQQNQPEPLTAQGELIETTFREDLLELEERITVGCLGKLKVNSIEKWRDAILKDSYDPQIDGKLVWGQNRCNAALMGTDVEKPNQQSSSDESEEEATDTFELCEKDPGCDVPKTAKTDVLTQNEDSFQNTVRSMASALLQVEQSIDIKFFRLPFGPKRISKDPQSVMYLYWQRRGQDRLLRWEASLMRATSFSQLFLHYHVLYDAIRWSSSIERAVCMVCRLKGDASVLLLCDECNRACHMYCLKPKLLKIPKGDWFCMRCRPEDHESKQTGTARKQAIKIKNDDTTTDESKQNSQDEDDSDESKTEGESTDVEFELNTESSSDNEEYESDSDEQKKFEETNPKIVIQKRAGVKKVNYSQSASRKTHNQTESLQRHSSPKRGRQSEPKKGEQTNKRSADTGMQKSSTRRTARNQEVATAQNQTHARHPPTKRTREGKSRKEGYAKKSKPSENIRIPSGGRRSLRLSTKEAL